MKNIDKKINDIIANFDFDKVHKTMTLLDWKWTIYSTFSPREERVPTIEDLKARAVEELLVVANKPGKHYSISCGGFLATKTKNSLALDFVISSWSSREEEEDDDGDDVLPSNNAVELTEQINRLEKKLQEEQNRFHVFQNSRLGINNEMSVGYEDQSGEEFEY